jgi:hypothetical protein
MEHTAVVGGDGRGLLELVVEPIEHVAGERVERDAAGQTGEREGGLAHLMHPARCPAQSSTNLDSAFNLERVEAGPGREVGAAGPSGQQVHVGTDVAVSEAPGEERPGVGSSHVVEACRRRSRHPRVDVGPACKEAFEAEDSEPLASLAARQRRHEAPIPVSEIDPDDRIDQSRGGVDAHRWRALAYSAAIVFGDRWT